MHHLLAQNVVIRNKEKHDIECCIKPSAGSVPKGLQRHYSAKKRVKKVNHPQY